MNGYTTAEMNRGVADTSNYVTVCEEAVTDSGITFSNPFHNLNSIKEDDHKGYYFLTDSGNRTSICSNQLDTSIVKTEPSFIISDVYSTAGSEPLTFEKSAVIEPSKNSKFHCTYCIKSFAKKQQLQNHTKTHTKEKNFHCETCQKSFIHKQQLANHEKTHTGSKEFSCSRCTKCFALKQQLQIHEKIHTGEKNFSCTMCEKAFITKQQLQNHINSHLGIKPFMCDECHKKFAHKQQLERHAKNHAVKQNYTCTDCGGKFLTKTSYTEHLKDTFHMEQKHDKLHQQHLNSETLDELPR